jgi:hypothetical protein
MKVTFFTLCLMGGGAERVMVNLSRAFAEKGMNVDFVLSEANGPLLEQVSSKVRIVDLKIAPLHKIGFLKASSYLQSVRSILPLMRYQNLPFCPRFSKLCFQEAQHTAPQGLLEC